MRAIAHMTKAGGIRRSVSLGRAWRVLLGLAGLVVFSALVWQGITASGNPNPTAAHLTPGAAILDTGVLVFREGLECILVLAAVTASMKGAQHGYQRPVALGGSLGFLASLITWFVVVGILSDVARSVPALDIQAGTGLVAVVVLLVIMNWFFHKIYWTGWISLHNRRKRALLTSPTEQAATSSRLVRGLILLGFTSVYREGFEVVLFLQSARLQVGSAIVLFGVLTGLCLTMIVGVLTFVAHHRLPYKQMLVLTGVLLGGVLLVMVGEQAQEMQLAHWIPTTPLNWPIPGWMGLWFSVIPTVETLAAQVLAAIVVIGSYVLASHPSVWRARGRSAARRAEVPPRHDAAPIPEVSLRDGSIS